MALVARDLVYPRGVIKPAQYPGETLYRTALENGEGIIDVWLEQASELTESEPARRAYVYERHYSVQAERLAEAYSSWSEGGISRSRNPQSVAYFRNLAAAQQAIFERLTGAVLPKAQSESGTTLIEGSF